MKPPQPSPAPAPSKTETPRIGLVLAAGGTGSRAGGHEKKQFTPLGGVPLLLRAVRPFLRLRGLCEIVVVLPPDDVERGAKLVERLSASTTGPGTLHQDVADEGAARRVRWRSVAGGSTRQESVRRGLESLPALDVVVVHDAARPLASAELARRVSEVAAAGVGAVPALPVTDTLKRNDGGGVETVPRAEIFAVQTPQAFPADMLREAHRRAAAEGFVGTDEASLCERYGYPVRLVSGEAMNIKITTREDWDVAERLIESESAATLPNASDEATRHETARPAGATFRTGIGYDVHALEAGRPCVLGGVRIDAPKGPAGHSDGDVLLHAIMDALLGAAGEPDIGHRYPPGDARYAGADSWRLLRDVAEAVTPRYEIVFVDSVVVTEQPRIAPHVPAMRSRIAEALGVPAARVNVKATTAEGLGATGRGEAISAQAVATLALTSAPP